MSTLQDKYPYIAIYIKYVSGYKLVIGVTPYGVREIISMRRIYDGKVIYKLS
jgi:hypothetical protein